ncbi:MAG: PH domain-containing protein [Planctomycetes bacterium]|nr:PH domain-containing protein [Planctomycetota bacterium]
MKQAIAGVAPPTLGEVTTMVTWPSMASTAIGRFLGGLFQIRFGVGSVLTVGNLLALATIPLTMTIYLVRIFPWFTRRYRLTNKRVVVERGLPPRAERWVELSNFDAIEVVVRPGQEWYPAGDLIFRKGPTETLRLEGVLRPETFRQTCLKAQRAFAGVSQALQSA